MCCLIWICDQGIPLKSSQKKTGKPPTTNTNRGSPGASAGRGAPIALEAADRDRGPSPPQRDPLQGGGEPVGRTKDSPPGRYGRPPTRGEGAGPGLRGARGGGVCGRGEGEGPEEPPVPGL